MKRETEDPTIDEHGDEIHPAFGMVSVNRVTSSPPTSLFDSEIKHSHYVVLSVNRASRKRSLNQDWIHPDSRDLIEIAMSEAQWASLVSSFNTQGVSCTIQRTETQVQVPAIPFDPRLAMSLDETKGAADRAFASIQAAMAAYEGQKNAANLRALRAAINNATANVQYAGETLVEHAEDVVQKARADIEAMLDVRARQLGIDTHERLVLGVDETPELDA